MTGEPVQTEHQTAAEPSPGVRALLRRRWLRAIAISAALLSLAIVVAGEVFARYWLRLGDPPLFMPDPDMRYVMVPGKTYRRLGNTISYNQFSMRGTPDFAERKSNAGEFRVFVLGDSVINGGPFTDDEILATRLLRKSLADELGRPVLVMNASAGSWGPPQEAAYLKKHGLFDADVLVVVLNHEDAFDDGAPRPLGPEQPTSRPLLALQEVVFRYLPAAIDYYVLGGKDAPPPKQEFARVEDASLRGVRDIVNLARSRNVKVCGVLYFSRGEIESGIKPGLAALRQQFRELSVPVVESQQPFREALRNDQHPFRDDIHPSPSGQVALLNVLKAAVQSAR